MSIGLEYREQRFLIRLKSRGYISERPEKLHIEVSLKQSVLQKNYL